MNDYNSLQIGHLHFIKSRWHRPCNASGPMNPMTKLKSLLFLASLSSVTITGYAASPAYLGRVVELPAIVVEASRLPDPVAIMAKSLEEVRAGLKAPSRLTLQMAALPRLAMNSPGIGLDGSSVSPSPARRLL